MTFSVLTVSKRTGWKDNAYKQINKQTLQPAEWITIVEGENAPKKIRASNLNRSLNAGLHKITSDYVVFYQDFIELPDYCFEKLLDDVIETGGFVTTATTENGKHDTRYLGTDLLRPCKSYEWEANVAIAPMKAIKELGGFDEEYDNGWSWDNVNLAERAAILGYEFYIDESIKPKLLFHVKEPELHPEIPPNGEFHTKRMDEIREGKYPLKLDYL